MSDRAKVGIVLVSHSAALAEGTAELAGQIGGGTVIIATAGGTDDGRIGTSMAKVQRALALADAGAGVLILPDLGSSVLTVRTLLADPEDDLPGQVAVADAPFVEGAVAATVTAAVGGDLKAVLGAAEEARHARKL
jgi:PTS hybrid protein